MARILLINDEPDLIEMCQLVLESAGHSVMAITDSSRAIEAAARTDGRPDVVLVDLVMPGVSGAEILQKLRGIPETADLPIVIMSALADARERAEEVRADGFLGKPFDPAALRGAIDHALAAAR